MEGHFSTDGGRDTASPKAMGPVGFGINTSGTEGSLDGHKHIRALGSGPA
jgi:hypothetical protein